MVLRFVYIRLRLVQKNKLTFIFFRAIVLPDRIIKMKQKITKTLIEGAQALNNTELKIWDTILSGFFVSVRPSGRKSFYAYYRLRNHKQQKIKLGDFPAMTVEEARERYKELTNQAFGGIDPVAAIRERARMDEPDPARNGTVNDLYEKYMAEHAIHKKASSALNDQGYWNNHILPYIGNKRVREVTRGDISFVHNAIAQKKNRKGELMTVTANRVLEVLSKAFNLAENWEWRPEGTNPCRQIKDFAEKKRRRYLAAEECVSLYNVLVEYLKSDSYRKRQVANLVMLLLFTGARKNEMMRAKWAYIVPERSVMALPDTKSNEPQDIQLSIEVLEILKRVRDDQQKNGRPGEYIFDGHNIGQPLKDEGRHWDNIRAEAGLRDFCLHDLRHSFASFMAVTTGSKIMIQQSLRHADPSTSDRYTHLINDPLRVAVGQTSSKIKDVMHGNKIVNFEDAKRRQMEVIARGLVSGESA